MVNNTDDEWWFHVGIWDALKKWLGFVIGLNKREMMCAVNVDPIHCADSSDFIRRKVCVCVQTRLWGGELLKALRLWWVNIVFGQPHVLHMGFKKDLRNVHPCVISDCCVSLPENSRPYKLQLLKLRVHFKRHLKPQLHTKQFITSSLSLFWRQNKNVSLSKYFN